MERRMNQRFYVGIPITYKVQVPESPENPWTGSGVLENISYGGLYFRSNDTPPLEEEQIRNFTFTFTKKHPTYPETDFIIAKCRVVRIDPQKPDHQDEDVGVALKFEFVSFKCIPYPH
jgi:c-di-GMP-binding flagellar brake protein YcgR